MTILKDFNVFNLDYLKSISIFKALEHISRQIKRKVICFSRTSDSEIDKCFETKEVYSLNKTLPICLMASNFDNDITNMHMTFIFALRKKTSNSVHRIFYYNCDYCPALYPSLQQLKTHVLAIHNYTHFR